MFQSFSLAVIEIGGVIVLSRIGDSFEGDGFFVDCESRRNQRDIVISSDVYFIGIEDRDLVSGDVVGLSPDRT